MSDAELFINVKTYLNSDLEPKAVVEALLKLREPLLTTRCRLYKELLKAREQYRHPKDKEFTDFDRTTMLEAQVAELQEQYELAKGFENLVKERLELYRAFSD